ncbi:MAG TPA: glucosamine-6-phosphate deaminase [Candidatus Paenibacillus intestinavium]|nr:glucosamine-6-phosphate deaminase [Candidatus Paenibacillus intestinavium]
MSITPQQSFVIDQLQVRVYDNRETMGQAVASDISNEIIKVLSRQDKVRMIFAAAPSQNEVLTHLVNDRSIDWSRVEAFHMDEYIGLHPSAPQSFGQFLKERIFSKVPIQTVNYMDSKGAIEVECERYGKLISAAPIDIVCLGIGENGHLAFNDPPVAQFHDPSIIKAVELDEICRQQQVNDGCFAVLDEVPTQALTLTIPTLYAGARLFCTVPSVTKQEAVRRTLYEEISTACPSTILRQHPHCTLYLEPESYGIKQ